MESACSINDKDTGAEPKDSVDQDRDVGCERVCRILCSWVGVDQVEISEDPIADEHRGIDEPLRFEYLDRPR